MQITGDLASLSISLPKGTSPVSLRNGEIVSALVKDATQEEVVLLIKGQTIRARAEAALTLGQRVHLQVQDLQEGRIIFKQVGLEQVQAGKQAPALNPSETLLARNGLPGTPGNLLLAQALISSGHQDISKEGLFWLSKSLSSSPNLAEAQALVHLFTNGQSLSSGHLASLQIFMQVLTGGLNPALAGTGEGQALMELLQTLSPENNLAEQLSIGVGEKDIAEKLAHLPERLGLDHEARLLAAIGQPEQSGTKNIFSAKKALLSMLQGEIMDAQTSPGTMNAARTVLQLLTGLQLLHLGQGEQGQLYLMGWLNWQGQAEQNPFFLSFFQNEKGGQGPGEPGRQVMLKTSTPRLGSILANLRVYGRYLSVEVAVDNPDAQKTFNRYADQLGQMMEGLPWIIQVLPCRLAAKEQVEREWPGYFIKPATHQRLDVCL